MGGLQVHPGSSTWPALYLDPKPAELKVYKGERMTCSTCTAELALAAHHQHFTAAAAPSWPSGWQNEKAQACDEHGRLYECDEDGWPLEPLQYEAHVPPATPTSPGELLLSPELIKAATDAFTAASPGAAPAPAGEHMRQLQLHQGPQYTSCHCHCKLQPYRR